jgi:hypothetical protein
MSLEDKNTNQQSPESTDGDHPAPNKGPYESPRESKLPAPSARLGAPIPLTEDEDAYADLPCTD